MTCQMTLFLYKIKFNKYFVMSGKQSVRSKVDSFFNQKKKVTASQELDHEGMLDEHMESMFKPTGQVVEMGRKTLGDGGANLQGKAYQGKKVSRADLAPRHSDSSSDDQDGELASEEGEEDMEDEMLDESMEDDMSGEIEESSEEEVSGESSDDLDKNAEVYNKL